MLENLMTYIVILQILVILFQNKMKTLILLSLLAQAGLMQTWMRQDDFSTARHNNDERLTKLP